ncbi:carboxymuconolactone decarboxylase family protein [Mycolicibacterium elephantis]|uniref:carboxymuconolactone decarboxylase family protein n=1 Tax=Mycolicibacterium elephantis TaxID=81858 RepID=UPI0006291F71|nr:carboxymuconolactone decarboxylase family protein [Mycolicibacterium elephantis]KKW65822.1 hypothetical protein AAV95_04725 [Mycolicibacterium elephantis]OBB16471.1 hypothetical protein A5762_02395 [Mycolicibacterium elephantis]OBE94923.1 hypothetical protein A5776_21505 [Mycolicibacterium elephantis]
MSTRLPRILPEQLNEQQRAVYERITGGARAKDASHFPLVADDGTLHGPFAVMVYEPMLGSILETLGGAIRFRTKLSPRLREIAILHVANAMDSEFEWWAHARVGKTVGLTSDDLDALSCGRFTGKDEEERMLATFCRMLLCEHNLTDREFADFSARLTVPVMIEVTVLVGYYQTLARLMRVFDIGLPPGVRTGDA